MRPLVRGSLGTSFQKERRMSILSIISLYLVNKPTEYLKVNRWWGLASPVIFPRKKTRTPVVSAKDDLYRSCKVNLCWILLISGTICSGMLFLSWYISPQIYGIYITGPSSFFLVITGPSSFFLILTGLLLIYIIYTKSLCMKFFLRGTFLGQKWDKLGFIPWLTGKIDLDIPGQARTEIFRGQDE
jgi:hypothetical protein